MRTYCFLIGHEWETRRIVTGVRVECRFCGAFGLYREDTQDFGVFWSPAVIDGSTDVAEDKKQMRAVALEVLSA